MSTSDYPSKETIADCLHSPACTDAEVHSALLRIGVPGARTSNQKIRAWLEKWGWQTPPAAQDELEALFPVETSAPPTVYTSLFHPNQLQALIQALPIRDGYTQWGRLHGMITRWLQTGDPNTATMPSEEPAGPPAYPVPPQEEHDNRRWREPQKAEKLTEPLGPRVPDNDMVICPNCTSQFRAIPVNVQHRLRRINGYNDNPAHYDSEIERLSAHPWLGPAHPNRIPNDSQPDKTGRLGSMPNWARVLLECRDALPAISLSSARLRNIDLTLADRIEAMLEPWRVTGDRPARFPAPASPNDLVRWICPKCTTVNGIADEVCLGGSCGTKRPEKAEEPTRGLSPSEAASFDKTLARSPRRVPLRDSDAAFNLGVLPTEQPEKASGEQP